ncbi:MAG TPA: hypothetical protein VLD13_11020 [Gaiellaceae bacterium]|nr:hypothetical protein [Gaiellaceae bacterium]
MIDRAALAEGETLLDVGCGEGLIGLGALERGAGRVIFRTSRTTCSASASARPGDGQSWDAFVNTSASYPGVRSCNDASPAANA